MAITLFEGLPGAGKSYEMTTNPIYQALCAGRRVVTNISGLNYDLIRQHALDPRTLWQKLTGVKQPVIPPLPVGLHNAHVLTWKYRQKDRKPCPETFGRIVPVSEEVITAAINEDRFFCTDAVKDAIVKPGDLVVLDECWQYFGKDCRISIASKFFFRKHRHYNHPFTGVSCDLILATQAVTALHHEIKGVIENTFYMVKLKALGLPSRYRVEVYDRTIISRSQKPITKYGNRYQKSRFAWYQSYDGSGGKEAVVDKRTNVLRNPVFWLGLPLLALAGVYSTSLVFGFISGDTTKKKMQAEREKLGLKEPSSAIPGASNSAAAPMPAKAPVSPWRITGQYFVKGYPVFLLGNADGATRYYSPVPGSGVVPLSIRVDGEEVTPYTGLFTSQKGLMK